MTREQLIRALSNQRATLSGFPEYVQETVRGTLTPGVFQLNYNDAIDVAAYERAALNAQAARNHYAAPVTIRFDLDSEENNAAARTAFTEFIQANPQYTTELLRRMEDSYYRDFIAESGPNERISTDWPDDAMQPLWHVEI